ncbi:thylakoid lumenal 15.0 kDa protein 2, chloroplastic [Cryptomeria japonica]|uniref:thylakoid lumenal 15.0 kDa protein 2, chloroplastic n=1 Tax=Cryptomeria japonica TaxID=3369 RepID=UPI0027DA412E|nr:thylakoid lumenal 15.0 kDa protein 2, chloroplastic [Cryptomeria japonica]
MEVGSDLEALQDISDWKIRVLTRTGPSPSPSENPLRDLWQPDDRTVIIVEDISSPNILNFGTGSIVASRLPRQFFIELQSRYGNQFFVSDEGYQTALLNTIDAIKQCLVKEDGCNTVPGLTDDLYFLTLATSMAGGAVFGFAARLTPQGRVDESWQWVVLLSPLWVLLFVLLGILPIVGRTSDLEPVLKNGFGFLGAAAAFYLTPLFGKSPIGKNQ